LLQVARSFDLTTGKDYVWEGEDANRNMTMTKASKDIDPGFYVDVQARISPDGPLKAPRKKKTDAAISPFYIEGNPGKSNQDGSKKGKSKTEASLWDFPGWSDKARFSLETAAKATSGPNAGYTYATLTWGFTISDAKKGTVENEYAEAHLIPSRTLEAAVSNFDEFYKNPGSSMAP
jgi:hypothetical protein